MSDGIQALQDELARARQKFPYGGHLVEALCEELGEAAREERPDVPGNREWLQVACVAMRLYEEGGGHDVRTSPLLPMLRELEAPAREVLEKYGDDAPFVPAPATPKLVLKTGLDAARALMRHVAGDGSDAFEEWLRKVVQRKVTGNIAVLSGLSPSGKTTFVKLLSVAFPELVMFEHEGKVEAGKLVVFDGAVWLSGLVQRAKGLSETMNVLVCSNAPTYAGRGTHRISLYQQDVPLPDEIPIRLMECLDTREDIGAEFRAWLLRDTP